MTEEESTNMVIEYKQAVIKDIIDRREWVKESRKFETARLVIAFFEVAALVSIAVKLIYRY